MIGLNKWLEIFAFFIHPYIQIPQGFSALSKTSFDAHPCKHWLSSFDFVFLVGNLAKLAFFTNTQKLSPPAHKAQRDQKPIPE